MRCAVPRRLCIGCGSRDEKSSLIRFTVDSTGTFVIGEGVGRGGYLHRRQECLQAFATGRAGMVRSLGVVLSREMRRHCAALIEQHAMQ